MTDNERIYKCEERYNKFLASCVSAISSDLSVQPVSYTHLDVYKRQTWDRGCVKTDRICGEMNTPVEFELVEKADTYFLKATPVKEIETLFAEKTEYENIFIKKDQPKTVNLKNSPYLLKLKAKKDKNVCIEIMLFDNTISCDFSKNHAVVNGESVPLAAESDSFEVVVVADTASIEVYFDGGISVSYTHLRERAISNRCKTESICVWRSYLNCSGLSNTQK